MREQNYTPGSLPPVEGRVDVAGDVEEEQRQAYSTHHPSASRPVQARKSVQGVGPVSLPPVEGRVDVAGDVEEEQRQAYSAHHTA